MPPELEKAVRERAGRASMRPERWMLKVIREHVRRRDVKLTAWKPLADWEQQFDCFLARQESTNPRVDDSRDSIYADR